jgi:hypothetical protein
MLINSAHIFLCDTGIKCYSQKLIVSNVAIRSYYERGIQMFNKAAADTAMLDNVYFYNAQTGAVCEIDCGNGHPYLNNIVTEGRGRYLNIVPYTTTRASDGLVIIEDSRDQIVVTDVGGTVGQIGDIQPKAAGRVITLTFAAAGFSINNDGNFELQGGTNLTSITANSSITLRRNSANTKWVEQNRCIL